MVNSHDNGSIVKIMLGILVLASVTLSGCTDLAVRDAPSLFAPRFQRSEIFGFVAGAGTTFAALPDLIACSGGGRVGA